jgi:hypothetical protein
MASRKGAALRQSAVRGDAARAADTEQAEAWRSTPLNIDDASSDESVGGSWLRPAAKNRRAAATGSARGAAEKAGSTRRAASKRAGAPVSSAARSRAPSSQPAAPAAVSGAAMPDDTATERQCRHPQRRLRSWPAHPNAPRRCPSTTCSTCSPSCGDRAEWFAFPSGGAPIGVRLFAGMQPAAAGATDLEAEAAPAARETALADAGARRGGRRQCACGRRCRGARADLARTPTLRRA